MKESQTKETPWNICLECRGLGKILRGPSRKRTRKYQEDLDTYKSNGGVAPDLPTKNMDVCPCCIGSGLVRSDSVTEINSNYPTLAIIGGGIGGTALAVACLHRGIPFTLYERDTSFDARSQGYGLTLQQASKAIAGLGIPFLEEGITSTKHVVHNQEGTIIGEWGLRKWMVSHNEKSTKRKNVHIARQSLRASLLERIGESDSVKWGHTLSFISENTNGSVNISFNVNGDEKTEHADLLVGADGIRSSVRNHVIEEHKTPLQYLGCIVILGICSLESLEKIESPLFDSATVFQTVNGKERIYVMPYDSKHIMWQLSFKMEEKEAQELSKKGSQAMKEEAQRRLIWHSPIPEILKETDSSRITGYPVYDREVLDQELLQNAGNITLIGDAAHPMSPFKGQGANQALLDALTLARTIFIECGANSKWREEGLRSTILNSFEDEMIQRTASKVRDSAKAVDLLHSEVVLHEGDEPRGRGLVV